MKLKLILLFLFAGFSLQAQKYHDFQFNIPADKNLLLLYETPFKKMKKMSYSISAGHKFNTGGQDLRYAFYFLEPGDFVSLSRTKVDFGIRSYAQKFEKQRGVNPYLGLSAFVGNMNRNLVQVDAFVPPDSLKQKVFYFGLEGTAGIKVVFFKKFILNPSFGLSHTFGVYNDEQISSNAAQWQKTYYSYENNMSVIRKLEGDTYRNRALTKGFGTNFAIYLNFGWRF